MARVRGSIPFSSNYEATISKPMDARLLVPSYADLLDNNNWLTSKGTPCCYNGMLVAVANTSDTSHNGLYMLFDATSSRKPNVTVETNWIKIGETSDISGIAERISSIEGKVSAIETDIKDLDARVKTLENAEPDDEILTFAYKSGFPTEGEEGKLYIAADKQCSYIWNPEQQTYIVVGSGLYEDIETDVMILDGGSAV